MLWLLGGYMWLFIHRPFEVWPVLGDLRIERVYVLFTVAVWAANGRKGWRSNRLNWAFGIFALALVASWLQCPYADPYGRSTKVVEDYAKVGVLYVLLVSCIRDEADLTRLLKIFLVAVALYATHSLREYMAGRHEYRMGTARMIGVDQTASDPNSFAASLVFALPMVLPFWFEARTWKARRYSIAFVALCATCVLLTGSRTAFIGLLIFLLVIIATSAHRFRTLMLIAAVLPIIWLSLPEDRQNRYMTLIDPSRGPKNAQESAEGRTKGWWDGVALWQRHPVFGAGPGVFGEATGLGFQAHHLYGQVLGELGTAGAIGLFSIVLCFAWNLYQARQLTRDAPELRHTIAYRTVLCTAMTVGFLLYFGFGGHNLYRYTWLWMGAIQVVALGCLIDMRNMPDDIAHPLEWNVEDDDRSLVSI